MKQFEEYNREVKKNVIDQWMKEGHSVKNVENDSVINLLLTALSYQAFHIHNNIDRFEEKVLKELRDKIIPFQLLKPIPAFSVIEAKLKDGCNEKMMDETCSFEFVNNKKQKFAFTPLLNTKVVNAELKLVNQLAENVWQADLQLASPMDSLSGMSFYIDTQDFIKIESIRYESEELPLIKPTQYSDLPFTKWFNDNHLFLNQNYYLFGTYHYWQEVFLTHSVPLYYIDTYNSQKTSLNKQTCIKLEIAFSSPIPENNCIKINCVPVVNVEKNEVLLDERNPVKDLTPSLGDFLNLLCDKESEKELENVMIRHYGIERYNATQLFDQMQEILYRYSSDYYAFQDIRELKNTDKLECLENMVDEFRTIVHKSEERILKDHHYAVLKKTNSGAKRVELKYLVTAGAMANGIKKTEKATKMPMVLDGNKTALLFETKGGIDGVKDEAQKGNIANYYFQTKDRLITPADIIVFIKTFYYDDNCCLGNEIESLRIERESEKIAVVIHLKNDSLLKNTDRLPLLADMLQNKITLRSSGIMPIQVSLF